MSEQDSSDYSKSIPTQTIRQRDCLINLEASLKFNGFEGSQSWPVIQRHINLINKIFVESLSIYASAGTTAKEPISMLPMNVFGS